MMYLTMITRPELQNNTYNADASTPNTITKDKGIPRRRALEKKRDNCTGIINTEGAAGAGLGYAAGLRGWRRWYPL